MVTPLDEVSRLLPGASSSSAELEGPQEVVGLLEVSPHREDFVDEVLHADDAVFAQDLYGEEQCLCQ